MNLPTVTTPAPAFRERADLPNTHGFRFVGLMHGNTEELCTVVLLEGRYTLACDAFTRLIKWRDLTVADTRRPLLQASFPIGGGLLHCSFALLNVQGQARAVIEREGSKLVRSLMGERTNAEDAAAFRAFVLSDASRALTVRQFGAELPLLTS